MINYKIFNNYNNNQMINNRLIDKYQMINNKLINNYNNNQMFNNS